MKSKSVAYTLWLFLGALGAHKFYLNKTRIGVLYFFTLGLLGIGWIVDLFTLGNQVDMYNASFARKFGAKGGKPANYIPPAPPSISEQLHKLHELKEKGILSEEEYALQKSKVLA